MSSGSIQIVIPVYNEAGNIRQTLGQIESEVATPHRIYIIYDFEGDNTMPVVQEFIKEKGVENILPLRNKFGSGVLNAIRTGFDAVDDGVVLVIMADGSDDMSIVDAMFDRINRGYDIVCGSRYMKGGNQIGGPRFKKFLSRAADISLHLLTGLPTHDATNSFKMYRKRVLDDIKIESNGGFEIGMEIVVKAFLKGYKITEIPSVWHARTAGKSRFKYTAWLPKYIRWYLYAVAGRLKKAVGGN